MGAGFSRQATRQQARPLAAPRAAAQDGPCPQPHRPSAASPARSSISRCRRAAPPAASITPEPHRFCFACWRPLTFLGDPCCARCGLPFAYGDLSALCGRCLADPPPFDRLRAAVAYGEIARTVVLKLKYSGRPGLAETLARFMLRHLPARRAQGRGSRCSCPVPLHRWRIWKRGYNQAALIASALSRRTGHRLRPRPAAPQAGDSAAQGPRPARTRARRPRRVRSERGGEAGARRPAGDPRRRRLHQRRHRRRLRPHPQRAGAASVAILCWARVVREAVD